MARPTRRARFDADVQSILAKGDLPGVQHIQWADDGFVVNFTHPNLNLQLSEILELRIIREDDLYLAYTEQNVPATVANVIEQVSQRTNGMKLEAMLRDLVSQLHAAVTNILDTNSEDDIMTDVDTDAASYDGYDEEDEEDTDFDFGSDNELDDAALFGGSSTARHITTTRDRVAMVDLSIRVQRDLGCLQSHGFKVGILSGFTNGCDESIVSASCRVGKLLLSKETLEAWELKDEDYIVLLIRYKNGPFMTFEEAVESSHASLNIDFRLRKCSKHRPSLDQALSAFSRTAFTTQRSEGNGALDAHVSHLCVGESLDIFMDTDFINMLQLRNQGYDSWDAAKMRLSAFAKAPADAGSMPLAETSSTASNPQTSRTLGPSGTSGISLPFFIATEHLNTPGEKSLSLIAAQFAFRYLLLCPKYCMVCHCRLMDDFESLKPYVCSDSLCLFQYMSLGFGPSVEHELLSQPYVVDLLISFCFASLADDAVGGKTGMREFPTGLGISVPSIRKRASTDTSIATFQPQHQPLQKELQASTGPRKADVLSYNSGILLDAFDVKFHWSESTIECESWQDAFKIQKGQLVVVSTSCLLTPTNKASLQRTWPHASTMTPEAILHHARVDYVRGTTVHLCIIRQSVLPIGLAFDVESVPKKVKQTSVDGHLILYSQNLDDMEPPQKAFSMKLLMDTIPPVHSMRNYLMSNSASQLAKWEGITPSALKLLRWIIASNRSFIVQIGKTINEPQNLSSPDNTPDDPRKIGGVAGWLQFRFAQGSPSQEVRFQEALKQVEKPQKTLIAWHGSPLKNWHSIIHEGLNYTETAHGRAYGNGVYFSKDWVISSGYSSMGYGGSNNRAWPNSEIQPKQAMALVEVVNQPERFQSSTPYFVVQHCEWIQCRYLFVCPSKTPPEMELGMQVVRADWKQEDEFKQDPQHKLNGPSGSIYIPRAAMGSLSTNKHDTSITEHRGSALGHDSDSEDKNDPTSVAFFQATHCEAMQSAYRTINIEKEATPHTPRAITPLPTTNFRPGTLDLSKLGLFAPPLYATPAGTKLLGRELSKLQKIQQSTPPQTLGWYIDFDHISNMFQWIVELHSFDECLPLAADLKAAGLMSIVLEMRFGREFPHSPPFVRVIRPRFLPFVNGGGGHVTAGGAMCMELLTSSGWSPVSSLESVLLQVRMAMCNVEPNPARLDNTHVATGQRSYGVHEAFDAYKRAAMAHGWTIPSDFQEIVAGSVDGTFK